MADQLVNPVAPSLSAFNTLADHIATLKISSALADLPMPLSTNAWSSASNLGFEIKDDAVYLLTVIIGGYDSAFQYIGRGSSLKACNTTSDKPLRIIYPLDASTAASMLMICFPSSTTYQIFRGANVLSSKTLYIRVRKLLD